MPLYSEKSFQSTKSFQSRMRECREAVERDVAFQISYQRPDGGYIWDGYAPDAFHKQAYSWSLVGHFNEGHKLLDWAKANKLRPDGQLEGFNGDIYKHAWFFQGALRLGRFEIARPVMKFLKGCQQPCGGLPHFSADKSSVLRSLSTAWSGVAALYFNDLEMAEKAAEWCMNLQARQPRNDRYYFMTDGDGKLLTEENGGEFIDTTKIKQCYWEVGFSMLLICKLYQITGNERYLESAKRYFEFKLACREDAYSYWGSGKSALAAAHYFVITGDERARDKALEFCDFVVETQRPNGGFAYEDEPDELLIYIDHAACFSVWGLESCAIMAGKLL